MQDYKFATLGEPKSGGLTARPYDLLPDNNIEVTVFKIMVRKTVDLHLTPLTLPILTKLQDDVESVVRSILMYKVVELTVSRSH